MVDKGILAKKQSDGRYFMYFAPNVRASLRDHVTRFARSAQSLFFGVEKRNEKICETPYEKVAKNYITRPQGE